MREESINPEQHHDCRPFCPCCGGGDWRKGYTLTKSKSRRKSKKAKKPKTFRDYK